MTEYDDQIDQTEYPEQPIAQQPYHVPETISTIDRLWGDATRAMAHTSGQNILTSVVVLSGLLSALFFWRFSQELFVGVHPTLALMLGLVVGLLPAEGAFLGWKSIRATKTDMTANQLIATQIGLVFAVACSVFGTFSLFVATVPFVPVEISQYANWLVFIAIALPVIGQMMIIAWYEINERGVVENFLQAKLNAMGFDAFMKFETARKQAVIEASNRQLEQMIEDYASIRGVSEVERLLRGNSAKNIGDHQPQQNALPEPEPQSQPNYYFRSPISEQKMWFESLDRARSIARDYGVVIDICRTVDDHVVETVQPREAANPELRASRPAYSNGATSHDNGANGSNFNQA